MFEMCWRNVNFRFDLGFNVGVCVTHKCSFMKLHKNADAVLEPGHDRQELMKVVCSGRTANLVCISSVHRAVVAVYIKF